MTGPAHVHNVGESASPALDRPRWLRAWLVGAAILAVLSFLGGAAWFFFRPASPPGVPPLPEISSAEVRQMVQSDYDALRADPWSAEKWGKTGITLHVNGHHKEALLFLEQAEKLDPADARWPYLQALIILPDNLAASLPFLERSALRFPDSVIPRWRLGDAYFRLGRLAEAEAHFQAIAEVAPNNGLPWLGLARIAVQRGQTVEALEFLAKATTSPLSVKEAYRLMASVYRDDHQLSKAIAAQAKFEELSEDVVPPDPLGPETTQSMSVRRQLSRRLQEFSAKEAYADAIEIANMLLEETPQDTFLLVTKGRLLINQGRASPEHASRYFAEAQKVLEQAQRLNPNESGVDYYLAMAFFFDYETRGGPEALDKALFLLDKAYKTNERDAHVANALSTCLMRRGDYSRALEVLKRNTASQPDFAPTFLLWGECLFYLGTPTEGYIPFRHAVSLGGKGAFGLEEMLLIALQQKM